MIQCEGALEPVVREVPCVPVAADVVDQHVEWRDALEHLGSEASDLRLGGEIGDEDVYGSTPSAADRALRGADAFAVPSGDGHVSPQPGETERSRQADTAGRARDQRLSRRSSVHCHGQCCVQPSGPGIRLVS